MMLMNEYGEPIIVPGFFFQSIELFSCASHHLCLLNRAPGKISVSVVSDNIIKFNIILLHNHPACDVFWNSITLQTLRWEKLCPPHPNSKKIIYYLHSLKGWWFTNSHRLLNRLRYRPRGHVWLIHYATGINACTSVCRRVYIYSMSV